MLAVMEGLGGLVDLMFAACAFGWVVFLLILFALVRRLESDRPNGTDDRAERPAEGGEKGR
jgi:hypothetical protein